MVSVCFSVNHPTSLGDVPKEKRHEIEKENGCCFVNEDIKDGEMIFIDCPLFDEMEKIDVFENDCVKVDDTYCCNTDKMQKHPPTCEDKIMTYRSQIISVGISELFFVVYNIIGLIGWIVIRRKAVAMEKEEEALLSYEEKNEYVSSNEATNLN